MKKNIYGIVIVILVALLLASCSGGHGVVSDDASDTSVYESELPSERPSPSGDTSGVIDLPWEIPEDIENPSQGLELAESYSKEFGDCYVVTGIGTCTDEDLVIPSTVNGIPVTEIANNAFYRNNKIKSVYCGNRVTVIGFQAFENCSNLKKVIIPDSVEKICEEAFCWCGLTEVQIGDRVKEMGRAAFQLNDRLKSVKLPYCLTVIPEDAFNGCTSLSEIEFSPNTVKIEKLAFDIDGKNDCTTRKPVDNIRRRFRIRKRSQYHARRIYEKRRQKHRQLCFRHYIGNSQYPLRRYKRRIRIDHQIRILVLRPKRIRKQHGEGFLHGRHT